MTTEDKQHLNDMVALLQQDADLDRWRPWPEIFLFLPEFFVDPMSEITPQSPSSSLSEAPKDWLLTQAFTRLQQRQFTDALKLLQGLAGFDAR